MVPLLIEELRELLTCEDLVDAVNLRMTRQDGWLLLHIMAVAIGRLGVLLATLSDPGSLGRPEQEGAGNARSVPFSAVGGAGLMSEVTGEVSSRRRAAGRVVMPCRRSGRSGGLGAGAALTDGRWWHHFPSQCAPGGDHDQSPVTGAHREGSGVSLLQNAQHVGDLLATIWAGPAPADNDPLADVGHGEPDHEPVAHAGHLLQGAAPCAAVGLATTPSAAGDVAGDVAGVIEQRAGLGGFAGRSELGEGT